jgi:hypothetical protein
MKIESILPTVFVADMPKAIQSLQQLGFNLGQHIPNEWAELTLPNGQKIGLHPPGTTPDTKAGTVSLGLLSKTSLDATAENLSASGLPCKADEIVVDKGLSFLFLQSATGLPLYLYCDESSAS